MCKSAGSEGSMVRPLKKGLTNVSSGIGRPLVSDIAGMEGWHTRVVSIQDDYHHKTCRNKTNGPVYAIVVNGTFLAKIESLSTFGYPPDGD